MPGTLREKKECRRGQLAVLNTSERLGKKLRNLRLAVKIHLKKSLSTFSGLMRENIK